MLLVPAKPMRFPILAILLSIAVGCGRTTSPPPRDIKFAPSNGGSVAQAAYEAPVSSDGLEPIEAAELPPDLEGQRKPSQAVLPYPQWGFRDTVRDSLGRIGESAVPSLERMLRHPDPQRRIEAAQILARIGPDAHEAVPGLVAALDDGEITVRKAAARALGQIGPKASQAVGPLLRLLEDEEVE